MDGDGGETEKCSSAGTEKEDGVASLRPPVPVLAVEEVDEDVAVLLPFLSRPEELHGGLSTAALCSCAPVQRKRKRNEAEEGREENGGGEEQEGEELGLGFTACLPDAPL